MITIYKDCPLGQVILSVYAVVLKTHHVGEATIVTGAEKDHLVWDSLRISSITASFQPTGPMPAGLMTSCVCPGV